MQKNLRPLLFVVLFVVLQACSGSAPSFAETPTNQIPLAQNTAKPTDTVLVENTAVIQQETLLPTAAETQALAAETKVFLPTLTRKPDSQLPEAFIADHRVIPLFSSIPQSAVEAARAKKVIFYHQSTGNYIRDQGLRCLAGLTNDPSNFPAECSTYDQNPGYYGISNWSWPEWEVAQADAELKMNNFISEVNEDQSSYEIIGMKFCYVDGWNQDFEPYRIKMEALEKQYPTKIFIWATSALWAEPGGACDASNPFNGCLAISEFNTKLRAYAKANNKPLYDIAAIESDGGVCQVAGYEGMCSEYYAEGGGHPNKVASIRLAKGFWWLVAKISGWN